MKNLFLCVMFAVIGIIVSLASGWNEGCVAGAWVGLVYAIVIGVFAAVVENQVWGKPWKEVSIHIACVVGGAILGAIGYTLA